MLEERRARQQHHEIDPRTSTTVALWRPSHERGGNDNPSTTSAVTCVKGRLLVGPRAAQPDPCPEASPVSTVHWCGSSPTGRGPQPYHCGAGARAKNAAPARGGHRDGRRRASRADAAHRPPHQLTPTHAAHCATYHRSSTVKPETGTGAGHDSPVRLARLGCITAVGATTAPWFAQRFEHRGCSA